ncbi:anti-sigma factor [Zeaxanthinibacter sp. PT1]|uniref:anti-sigma factor n=1 Tax=Zeaxanthinibacter TaxID=561554 RepID=UPI002349E47B|nr:anti-sigma factor [Zeaxanthinibacter sp. PT1]MDC6352268.1 anti-sigma factor [Zeaxanthinibacter sp. PT1]
MDIEKYISSGILELYVAGLLTEAENKEVSEYAKSHPEIEREIRAIEASVLALSKAASPGLSEKSKLDELWLKIDGNDKKGVVKLKQPRKNWFAYSGWAAAAVLLVGLWWVYNQNQELRTDMQTTVDEVQQLENQIEEARYSLTQTQELFNSLRDKDVTIVPLSGQKVAPDAYARAYWKKDTQQVYIDAQGLPEPPSGMVYQVWSLKLSPLTPTSIGLLDSFATDDNKVFILENANESEAFGITLEPAGGSETPTLEQLYTLGAVAAS